MSKYSTVFIDADETLYDFELAEKNALARCFEDFQVELSKDVLSKYLEINKGLWVEIEKGTISQLELRTERFRRLFAYFGIYRHVERFSNRYLEWLGKGTQLLDGAEDLCIYLKSKYRLVVITNGIKEVQHPRIENSKLAPYFDAVIVSEDIGYAKPDVRLFDHAAALIELKDKAEVIMVGDSLSSDIQGGINFGIDTCWVNLKNQDKPENLEVTYVVTSLEAIKEIL